LCLTTLALGLACGGLKGQNAEGLPMDGTALPTDVVPGAAAIGLPSSKHEVRAVWVTTLGGLDWPRTKSQTPTSMARQKKEFCDLLDKLKGVNINTVLLQTRVRGSVIYPSAIEPWDEALTGFGGRDPGYDPLRFAVEECHKRGMELHAWVVCIPCFKVDKAKGMGRMSVLRTHPKLCKRFDDMWYLDPGMPGTAEYLTDICREIVRNYDVDGIHFDYIRYPENAPSFPDAATFKKYGHGMSKADWRRQNITHIVQMVYQMVKAMKPWVKVSSSPIGKFRDLTRYSSRGWNGYDAVYQDSEGWLQSGIHDMLFPMMYFQGDHFFPFALDWQESCNGRPVVPGLGIYFMSPEEKNWPFDVVGREMSFLRIIGMGGEAFFRSKFLTDNVKGIYDFLKEEYYTLPALTPPMTWQRSQLPDAPQGLQRVGEKLVWKAPESGSAPSDGSGNQLFYNVYASDNYPVDVSLAQNLKAVKLTDGEFRIPFSMLWGKNFAVTAMDRYGNESRPATTARIERQVSKLLPVSADRLTLPDSNAEFVVIVPLTGNMRCTFRYAKMLDVSILPRGFYEVRTLEPKGNSRRLGMFVVGE
jgi:uncharacterized lipoprotein YddW (UPF0748 family)